MNEARNPRSASGTRGPNGPQQVDIARQRWHQISRRIVGDASQVDNGVETDQVARVECPYVFEADGRLRVRILVQNSWRIETAIDACHLVALSHQVPSKHRSDIALCTCNENSNLATPTRKYPRLQRTSFLD